MTLARRLAGGAALGLAIGALARDLGLAAIVSYQGGRFPLILGAAIGGALLAATRLRRVLPVLLGTLATLWLVVAATPVTRLLVDDLVRRDPPARADAVFVLASDVQPDGDLGSVAIARLQQGFALLHAGHAPRLVVGNIAGSPAHGEAVRRMASDLGVDGELLTVGPVNSTYDEAVALAALFRERGWRRVLLVTSPLHSRRAAATFARQGLEVISVPSRESEFNLEALLSGDDRLRAFGSFLHERVGLVVYGWRGWL